MADTTKTAQCAALVDFQLRHIDEDCESIEGFHEKELFFNCVFKNLNGLTLKDCDLNKSKFLTDRVEDALGFTLTLDCNSFQDVEYSELLFDLLLVLIAKTKGNTEKRRKIVDILGKNRVLELLQSLSSLER
jgi:hypothetical protein